ncbi:aminopeptidase N [Aestuariimicrobium ganziense]|uniref:aminopeptidase N n=1 Tax=Aestuariimicrobium ganziense TaxID=2773677 RepID=UPI001F362105|nr:aminopeptidase N [Aestuariimicrobium ganziense]
MAQPLTADEAAARARVLWGGQVPSPAHVDLVLDLRDDDFTSTATWAFPAEVGSSTFVDVDCRTLVGAELNQRPLDPSALSGRRLRLDDLAADNRLAVQAVMDYSHDGEGLHRHVDPADGAVHLYAMSFLDAAPRWFACFDQPDLKFGVDMTVHTPDPTWIVRGNGPVEQLGPTYWHWRQPEPLASYLVTVVAGPWQVVAGEHDGIRLEVLARRSMAEQLHRHADDVLAVTATSFDGFHDLFGVRYAYGDYAQVFVPDFNAGAMEKPGCVLFREQMLFRGAASSEQVQARANTIAHELAHQWFGDLVTMAWWDDLWLNESFAEHLAGRVLEERTHYRPRISFGARKAWGHEADQAPSTHPVAGNGAADTQAALANFDGISYAKGAALLGQLAARVGDEVFLAGLRDHITGHAGGNATAADLFASWTRAGVDDLDRWVDVWLRTSGLDLLRVEADPDCVVRLVREAPESAPRWRPHAVQVAALTADGRELVRVSAEVADEPVALEPAAFGLVGERPEPMVLVPDAADQTWARIRLADWRVPAWAGIDDPMVRVVILNALRDGIRHADLDSGAAFRIILDTLTSEDEPVLFVQLAEFAQGLAGRAARPEHRDLRQQALARVALRRLDDAAPGSDLQLIAWRLLLATSSDTGLLGDWLAGDRLPQGRELDQELRWLAVRRLQQLGAEPGLVDDELRRDPTSAGDLAATTARASRPDAGAKRAALEVLLHDRDASNAVLLAIAEGLFLPGQDEFTADLVEPWLEGMAASAEFRGGWTLQRVVAGSVPWGHATPQTLAAFDRVLARGDLAAPVRRELVDARAKLDRLVRLRERSSAD